MLSSALTPLLPRENRRQLRVICVVQSKRHRCTFSERHAGTFSTLPGWPSTSPTKTIARRRIALPPTRSDVHRSRKIDRDLGTCGPLGADLRLGVASQQHSVASARTAVLLRQSLPARIVGMLRADRRLCERHARRSASTAATPIHIVAAHCCSTSRARLSRPSDDHCSAAESTACRWSPARCTPTARWPPFICEAQVRRCGSVACCRRRRL